MNSCSPKGAIETAGHRPVCESARGLAHSKTLARFRVCLEMPKVLDCGSPLPLSLGPPSAHEIFKPLFQR
ncbi:MAG: hypothetical protein C5B50_22035 [Verrucomicrobia bacterium]|nr:MAG: hypothetical protein C5B50_22035 [Verrucomicrobiota bacterium]